MTNMGQTAGNIQTGEMSFWEHLDVLRASLIKIAITTVLCGIVAFSVQGGSIFGHPCP